MLLWELSILLPEKKFVSPQHKLICMLICIFHDACRGDRVTVAVFLLFITRVYHTTIRVTHVFITRVVPRVTLRVIVAPSLKGQSTSMPRRSAGLPSQRV